VHVRIYAGKCTISQIPRLPATLAKSASFRIISSNANWRKALLGLQVPRFSVLSGVL
jgi:hypothetical protein